MAANELDDVIQRWRITKEKDLKPEDHELFLNIAGTCIAQSDTAQLLDFIKEEKNQNIVKSMGCGLLGPLIKEVVEKKRDPVNCEAIITYLVQICRANDLLDVLLREMEDADPDAIADAIILLMQHVQLVLSRLGDSKALSLGRALDALQKQISKLPVPYSRKQEQEDKYGLCRCCTALLTFVQPFVQEVKSQDIKSPVTTSNDEELRTVLLKFCMQSLRDPLLEAQLDREADTSQNSPLWKFATEIMDLYVKSLERVLDNSLPVQLLELRTFYSVPQILVKIMIECPIQHLRVKALIVFQLFIEKLNGEAKHKFFRCIMKTSQHAGVESIILKNIKNQVEHSSKSEQRDGWFEGTLLITLLRDTVNLPQGPETDLLHGMDRVMESLNLLRYLLIKERSKAVRQLHKNMAIKTTE
ncbi:hypothetical protein MHYP_G00334220 [Metynnis hypsauchen]